MIITMLLNLTLVMIQFTYKRACLYRKRVNSIIFYPFTNTFMTLAIIPVKLIIFIILLLLFKQTWFALTIFKSCCNCFRLSTMEKSLAEQTKSLNSLKDANEETGKRYVLSIFSTTQKRNHIFVNIHKLF